MEAFFHRTRKFSLFCFLPMWNDFNLNKILEKLFVLFLSCTPWSWSIHLNTISIEHNIFFKWSHPWFFNCFQEWSNHFSSLKFVIFKGVNVFWTQCLEEMMGETIMSVFTSKTQKHIISPIFDSMRRRRNSFHTHGSHC